MKLVILFVVASLILVGATIAVSVPNQVHADPKNFKWCYEEGSAICAETKKECKELALSIDPKPQCTFKQPTP